MKIEFKKDSENNTVGYDLIPQTEQDHKDLGKVRDLIFFGIGEKSIKYAGRKMKEGKEGSYDAQDIERLKFLKKGHL